MLASPPQDRFAAANLADSAPAVAGLPVRQSDRLVPRGEPGELVLERAGSQ